MKEVAKLERQQLPKTPVIRLHLEIAEERHVLLTTRRLKHAEQLRKVLKHPNLDLIQILESKV